MLPKKTTDSYTCLQTLVGVRAKCDPAQAKFGYYIEDLEGVDIKTIADIANIQSPSGRMFGEDIIDMAAREMLGDMELLLNSGYTLIPTFGELCNTCSFSGVYQPNSGVQVTNNIGSNYSKILISTIDVLTNHTVNATLVLDDNKQAKQYPVLLQAGVVSPLELDYTTTERVVEIYFTDSTIGLAQMNCYNNNSCGCGGGSVNSAAHTAIKYTGFVGSVNVQTLYGFKVCASVMCDNDMLVCDLIRQTPKLFGLTLLYKTGAKYYSEMRLSERLNRTTGVSDEKKVDMAEYYTKLYQQRLRGAAGLKGIASIVGNYLAQRKDRCVTCESTAKVAWATG
jgi:hypothetical protein